MALNPDLGWPASVDPTRTNYLVAVKSQVVAPMADAQLHMVGWRGRPAAHNIVGWDVSGIPAGLDQPRIHLLNPDTVSHGSSHSAIHNPIRVSPFAIHLALAIEYQAYGEGPSLEPSITARLDLKGGATIDTGCQWAEAEGVLDTDAGEPILVGVSALRSYPVKRVTTSLVHATGASRAPSMLNVGSDTDKWLDVVVETAFARIISVAVYEVAEPTIR